MLQKLLFPFHHFSRAQIASRKREGHLNVMVKEFESHKKIQIGIMFFCKRDVFMFSFIIRYLTYLIFYFNLLRIKIYRI